MQTGLQFTSCLCNNNLFSLVALLFKDQVRKLKNKFKEYAMSNNITNKMKEFALSNGTATATHLRCQTFFSCQQYFFLSFNGNKNYVTLCMIM